MANETSKYFSKLILCLSLILFLAQIIIAISSSNSIIVCQDTKEARDKLEELLNNRFIRPICQIYFVESESDAFDIIEKSNENQIDMKYILISEWDLPEYTNKYFP